MKKEKKSEHKYRIIKIGDSYYPQKKYWFGRSNIGLGSIFIEKAEADIYKAKNCYEIVKYM